MRKIVENRERRRQQWRAEARRLWESWREDSFFVLGVGLYWGEGTKCRTAPRLALTNSDVNMLRVRLRWCRRFMPGVPLDYPLVVYDRCNIEHVRQFWKNQLGIDVKVVTTAVSSASKRKRNSLPHGTLKVRVGRSSVEWLTKMLVWLELAQQL